MKTPEAVDELRYWLSQGWRVSRFLSQSVVGNLLLGRRPTREMMARLPSSREVLLDLLGLFERDRDNIRAGVYRLPEKDPLNDPVGFARSSFRVFRDLVRVQWRQRQGRVQEIPEGVKRDQFPSYYTQTFHYQTDGYLSESSAELYDHQVELVFAGGADAMRRMCFPWIRSHLEERGLGRSDAVFQLLDVPCGTGRFLTFVKSNLPEVHVTGIDLSPFYLKKARQNLARFERADFVEANAESTPFKDGQFDVVSSIYLMHELPERARPAVIRELVRILKPGGLLVLEDSIQKGDKPSFDGALDYFPLSYHEPYFRNYAETPLEPLFQEAGLSLKAKERAWFSKIWVLEKSPS